MYRIRRTRTSPSLHHGFRLREELEREPGAAGRLDAEGPVQLLHEQPYEVHPASGACAGIVARSQPHPVVGNYYHERVARAVR
ncbi:MAG: hypothetical protein ACOCW3_05995, partial [Spirochaetota bacterium]